MNVVIWSRRFDGEDRPLSDEEARELGIEGAQRQVAISSRRRPARSAARSDVLSVHLALGPETKHLVNAAVLAQLKPGAMSSTPRAARSIDHAALAAAIREKGLRSGSTCSPRAGGGDRRLRRSDRREPGVYGTHHIGASTDQAQEAIAAETVRIVRSYKETGRVPNVVNLATLDSGHAHARRPPSRPARRPGR